MSTALTAQIIVYMAILSFISFAWGYSKGHRDGIVIGRIKARKLQRLTKAGE